MSSTGETQRSSGNGFFVGSSEAAKAGNAALEKGFNLQKATAAARETGKGPGTYFAGTREEYAAQQPIGLAKSSPAYKAGRSEAVRKGNITRGINSGKKNSPYEQVHKW